MIGGVIGRAVASAIENASTVAGWRMYKIDLLAGGYVLVSRVQK
jgi:hypothetical protein